MKRIISILIIIFVAFVTGNFAARVFHVSNEYKANNLETIVYHTRSCTPTASAEQGKKVVLRIDDVQDGFVTEVSRRMILDAKKQKMKLVLGVIPKDIAHSKELVSTIRNNACSLEIAQHGWEHAINGDYDKPEFANISKEDAKERLHLGLKSLSKLTRSKITTFIPPQNKTTRDTRVAIKEAGFKRISSEGKRKYDYDSSTFDWKKFKLVPVSKVMSDCKKAFSDDGKCIIMLHPQDYATNGKVDRKKYKEYLRLLRAIEKAEATTVTFKEL